ncbi:TPA: hypothetical protein ACQ2HY_003335 [Klebsiella pneumoniae]
MFFIFLFISSVALLSGCANLQNSQVSDYDAMCSDYTFKDSDKGKVVFVDRSQDFFNTEDGEIYSKRELDLLKSPQSVLIGQLTGVKRSEIDSAKKFLVTRYRFKDSSQYFCGNVSSSSDSYNDSRGLYNGQLFFISDVKESISAKDFYNHSSTGTTGFILKPYKN